MKRISKAIIPTLLLFIGGFTINQNTSSSVIDYYVTTANLNVRIGAGTGYPVCFVLQKGEEVQLISKKNNWYRIKYLEKTGYAYSHYLKYSKTIPDPNSSKVEPTPYIFTGIFASIILFAGLIILFKIRDEKWQRTAMKSNRGTWSERDLVFQLLKYGIPEQMIFHDLYVKKHDGGFSQIDLAVITATGIIVFEVKDYSGWIFGNGNQLQWTQVLAYGKHKYRFYNPILQNHKHIECLRRQLKPFGNIPFYSVVLFYGNCELKDIRFVPNGTFLVKSNRILEVMSMIIKTNEPVRYTCKNEIIEVLKEAVRNGEDVEVQNQHSDYINSILGKDRILD